MEGKRKFDEVTDFIDWELVDNCYIDDPVYEQIYNDYYDMDNGYDDLDRYQLYYDYGTHIMARDIEYTVNYIDDLLRLVPRDSSILGFVNEKVTNNPKIMLEMVKQNWTSLRFASEEVRNNTEVVMEAIRQDARAFEYAGDDVKSNFNIMIEALKTYERSGGKLSDNLTRPGNITNHVLHGEYAWGYTVLGKIVSEYRGDLISELLGPDSEVELDMLEEEWKKPATGSSDTSNIKKLPQEIIEALINKMNEREVSQLPQNIKVLLIPTYKSQEELREEGIHPSATVEAEYGEKVIEGEQITLAHHTNEYKDNPAPCNTPNVPILSDDSTIVISHLDLDTLRRNCSFNGKKNRRF